MQLKSLEETKNFSENISKIIKPGDTIFLYGDIGAGKTTFVKFCINYLESKNGIRNSEVLSPTFNILYDYTIKNIKILHYDLYRIKNNLDVYQLGIFESSKEHIKIVEWPELIDIKPKDRIDILLKHSKSINSRKVEVVGFGKWKNYNFNEI
jgi:tRNA threonylcarbamoyladenosine biosynthesis protein TsaE|tara:strand:- start:23 stop:478 length:456 start_codon:yes stop_codon:yes gene_type:complete